MTPPSPPDDSSPPDDTTGPPDQQTLRLLERQCTTTPLVANTEFQPDATMPRRVSATLAIDAFPESVATATLEIRWFTTGDFSIQYVETTTDNAEWRYRWDRHPNPYNARLHFHEPPDSTTVSDLSLESTHPLDVYATVVAAIQQRLADHWDDTA